MARKYVVVCSDFKYKFYRIYASIVKDVRNVKKVVNVAKTHMLKSSNKLCQQIAKKPQTEVSIDESDIKGIQYAASISIRDILFLFAHLPIEEEYKSQVHLLFYKEAIRLMHGVKLELLSLDGLMGGGYESRVTQANNFDIKEILSEIVKAFDYALNGEIAIPLKVETPNGLLGLTSHLFKRWEERTNLDMQTLLECLYHAVRQNRSYHYNRKTKTFGYADHLVSKKEFVFVVVNDMVVTMYPLKNRQRRNL